MQPHEPYTPDEEYPEGSASWPQGAGQIAASDMVRPNLARRARQFVLSNWEPKPLPPPKVDPDLLQLTPVERSTEVLRHSILSLEYWLSPSGVLREWIRFNLRLAAVLAVPALLVVPLVSFALREINSWVGQVVASTSTFLMFPLSALLIVGLVSALMALSRSILRNRQQPRRDPYHYQ